MGPLGRDRKSEELILENISEPQCGQVSGHKGRESQTGAQCLSLKLASPGGSCWLSRVTAGRTPLSSDSPLFVLQTKAGECIWEMKMHLFPLGRLRKSKLF